jgi:hypothetical protein
MSYSLAAKASFLGARAVGAKEIPSIIGRQALHPCLPEISVSGLKEAIASVPVALLGLGVLLFDTKGQSRLQIAVLGAAFPSLFTGLVAASSRPGHRGSESGFPSTMSSIVDYLSWRR